MNTINKYKTSRVSTQLKNFVAILISTTPLFCFAASFNCQRAVTSVEKLVCDDSVLSVLDSQLTAHYKEALNQENARGALVASQKKWILERNKCTSVECLKFSYRQRDAVLRKKVNERGNQCLVDEKNLLGYWVRKNMGDFEEFNLSISGTSRTFVSWLHHQPEFTGVWEVKDCTLNVNQPNNPALDFSYRLKSVSSDLLELEPVDTKAQKHRYLRPR